MEKLNKVNKHKSATADLWHYTLDYYPTINLPNSVITVDSSCTRGVILV